MKITKLDVETGMTEWSWSIPQSEIDCFTIRLVVTEQLAAATTEPMEQVPLPILVANSLPKQSNNKYCVNIKLSEILKKEIARVACTEELSEFSRLEMFDCIMMNP